jgi:hypothetical protein
MPEGEPTLVRTLDSEAEVEGGGGGGSWWRGWVAQCDGGASLVHGLV